MLQKYRNKVDNFQSQVRLILEEEKEEKFLARAEMEATKAENLITHAAEIAARPARTWFQSEHQKQQAKAAAKQASSIAAGQKRKADSQDAPKRSKTDGLNRRKKRRMEALREMKEEGLQKSVILAARHAKAAVRPSKLSSFPDPNAKRPIPQQGKKKRKDKGGKGESGAGSSKEESPKKAAKKPFVKGKSSVKGFKSKSKYKRR